MANKKVNNTMAAFPIGCAIFSLLLGVSVIAGWWLEIPQLVQIIPGTIGMVFNTALCFVMAGTALFLTCLPETSIRLKIITLLGVLIIVLSCLVLSQDFFSYTLRIDHLFSKMWFLDENPNPGRMAPNTALTLIFIGIIFTLIPYVRYFIVRVIIQIFNALVIINGVFGFMAYFLNLQVLHMWYHFTPMAIHTASGIIILSVGLWARWEKQAWYKDVYRGKENC